MATNPLEANPRGIPKAPFVGKVEEFVNDGETEAVLRKFQEMLAKYKYMEVHGQQRKKNLESKIPEIKKTFEMVNYLISREEDDEPIETQYELTETLWANARIKASKTVCIWLGANVMLEYANAEARDLLTQKLSSATKSLAQVEEDLEFLREQITTMEVNTAQVYNYDVKLRRAKKA
ncbi:Prefoldin subunit-domain-containing protein [Blyttiomyces helicus]|uniref:Prefoldin subunit 3 n=1 Tax=Blyttiomyces helicus TaxID=388810 RepID=A0A4V1IPJ0_9FUNG|nr:Prefoldin subunit-domain-containing protein [Blyttiomyces helicus]|eukprot:RKO83227.1 Prefoldin subunit-domain-containing protein [Blyttiomyces helicus]